MIKYICDEHYNDFFVQFFINASGHDCAVMDTDKLVLLKSKNELLINDYLNNPNKTDFSFNECIYERPHYLEWDSERYNEILSYDKSYFKFEITDSGYRFNSYYFLKYEDGVYCVKKSLPVDCTYENTTTKILDKKELEDFFDYEKYDSMYLINREGNINFAFNKNDGIVIDSNIIPTEGEIIKLDLRKRERGHFLHNTFNLFGDIDNEEIKAREIYDITNLPIYEKGMFHGYYNALITSLNGEFNVNWIGLDLISKDKYKLALVHNPVIIPTIDYVSDFIQNNKITPAASPIYDTGYDFSLKHNDNISGKRLTKSRF